MIESFYAALLANQVAALVIGIVVAAMLLVYFARWAYLTTFAAEKKRLTREQSLEQSSSNIAASQLVCTPTSKNSSPSTPKILGATGSGGQGNGEVQEGFGQAKTADLFIG
jgi:hypothetical protein